MRDCYSFCSHARSCSHACLLLFCLQAEENERLAAELKRASEKLLNAKEENGTLALDLTDSQAHNEQLQADMEEKTAGDSPFLFIE